MAEQVLMVTGIYETRSVNPLVREQVDKKTSACGIHKALRIDRLLLYYMYTG